MARQPSASAPAPAGVPTPAPAPLPVLGVASEMFPLVKTGGLADVAGALPAALAPEGIALRTLLPGLPGVMKALAAPAVAPGLREAAHWPGWFGGTARLLCARVGAADLVVLDAPHLYDRPGGPYVDPQGRDWPDNPVRFAALALAAARIGWGEAPLAGPVPALLHLHDWQAALAPAYLRYLSHGRPAPATVLTIHNLAFQGQFGRAWWPRLGLPDAAFATDGVEYHGDIGFLKAGLQLADAITTVSPTYAREVLQPADGMGLDGLLRWRERDLLGIVNGIDTEVWNPATDTHLAAPFSADDLAPRVANKRALERRFELAEDDGPLLCMISRLTPQKGIDLVAQALDGLVGLGLRLAVLGSGDAGLEQALQDGARRHPGRVAVRIGYDEGLSHLMQGGADAIVVPSRFEPCGLTQLCALRYGCVPLVSRVGGLADTVVDANHAALMAGVATGVVFSELSVHGLLGALQRLASLYAQGDTWRTLQGNGLRADVGWRQSARDYAALYRRLGRPTAPPG